MQARTCFLVFGHLCILLWHPVEKTSAVLEVEEQKWVRWIRCCVRLKKAQALWGGRMGWCLGSSYSALLRPGKEDPFFLTHEVELGSSAP